MSTEQLPISQRWSRFRFSVIGHLLACPPQHGQLQKALETLAATPWLHPIRNAPMVLAYSTLERWFYQARAVEDPIAALANQPRSEGSRVVTEPIRTQLERLYTAHKDWSYQLHYDNLVAWADTQSERPAVPSYPTIRREMQRLGWRKQKALPLDPTPGQLLAITHRQTVENRQFEVPYVHGLWHTDFHHGSLKVLDEEGRYHVPRALAFLDDASRLCCHLQWFLAEDTQCYVHGLLQAIAKRGLPRVLMTDNGPAFVSSEATSGLSRLGISHATTLPYSPQQNGKQERFWATLEGRFMNLMRSPTPLTLAALNHATQAWVELEYNRRVHSQLEQTPLDKALASPSVARPAPDVETLRRAFTQRSTRRQRADGTIAVSGKRFELPTHLRALREVSVRFRSWDLSLVYIVDAQSDQVIAQAFPQDLAANASGRRRALSSPESSNSLPERATAFQPPPLLTQILEDFAALGLPPAYLPMEDANTAEKERSHES